MQDHKQRVAFFSYPFISHILPYLKMFEVIKEKYLLDLYTCEDGLPEIESHFDSVIRLKSMQKLRPDQLPKALLVVIGHTSSLVEEVENIWAFDKDMVPNLILSDFFSGYASIISKTHKINCVSLYSFFQTDPDTLNKLAEETATLPYTDTEKIQMNEEVAKIEKKYGFEFNKTKSGIFNMIELGYTENRISHSPKSYPYALSLLPDLKLMGPLFRDNGPSDFDFSTVSKKVIYFSLGTLFFVKEIFDIVTESFLSNLSKDFVLLVSCGSEEITEFIYKKYGEENLRSSGCIYRKSWNQIHVLGHSDLFISHLGYGSYLEGLFAKVPFIGVPFAYDQIFIANELLRLQIGEVIKTITNKEEWISKISLTTQDPKYRKNVEALNLEYGDPKEYLSYFSSLIN